MTLGGLIILNYIFICKLLKRLKKGSVGIGVEGESKIFTAFYKEALILVIPLIMIAIIFCFQLPLVINSIGIAMFWGLLIFIINNIVLTRALFVNKN